MSLYGCLFDTCILYCMYQYNVIINTLNYTYSHITCTEEPT